MTRHKHSLLKGLAALARRKAFQKAYALPIEGDLMRKQIWVLLLTCFVVIPNRVLANTWTPSTSEEQGLDTPAVCADSHVSGLRCDGKYCDNVSLLCGDVIKSDAGAWSASFSEEDPAYICPSGEFVQSLRCEGRYCDKVSVQCAKPIDSRLDESSCSWRPEISDGNGGVHDFGKGSFLKETREFVRRCDTGADFAADNAKLAF